MSVERDRNGNGWVTRWREPGRQNPRSRLFALKRDAEAFDREVKRRGQLGPLAVQQLTARGGPTLGQWIVERWAPEHAVTLEQSTRDRYANVHACHVAPRLDDVPLNEFTVARLRGWQAELVKAGVNPGTIHKARTFLSSVLRHAAESEAIPGNPLSLVRPPKAVQRDAVRPLAPATVETIRRALLDPPTREVAASRRGQRNRRRYEMPAPGTPQTRQRDALIVSLLAYAGVRPGELRAQRLGDAREKTLLVERAANPDGTIKATKNEQRRAVRLLAPLGRPCVSTGSRSAALPTPAFSWSMTTVRRGTRPPGRCGASTAGPPRAARSAWTPCRGLMTSDTALPHCCWPKGVSRFTWPSN